MLIALIIVLLRKLKTRYRLGINVKSLQEGI